MLEEARPRARTVTNPSHHGLIPVITALHIGAVHGKVIRVASYRRKALTAGLAVMVIGGVAAGAARLVGSAGAASPTPWLTTFSSNPTPADPHYAAALAEAQHLFPLAHVPPQAKRASPGAVKQPPLQHQGNDRQAIRVSALWTIAEPPAMAWTWIKNNPPQGLQPMADGYTHTQFAVYARQIWIAPDTDAFSSARLTIVAAGADPGPATIEVEAEVLWVTSATERDATSGPKVRVSLAGGCPASVHGMTDVSNPGTDLANRLLPPGIPTSGLICRYAGGGTPLLVAAPLRAAPAQTLAAAVSAIRTGVTATYQAGCPVDDIGNVVVIVLAYRDHPDVDLWYQPGGCAWLANGFVRVTEARNLSFTDFGTVLGGLP